MKNFFKKYLFVFEFIAVAILITVGIVLKINEHIFMYIVGIALVIFGAFRIIPLIKTTEDKLLKWIYAGEILISVAAGVLLFLEGNKGENYNKGLLRWFIGAILYIRGFVYVFSTAIRKESTDYIKFFVHMAVFTLGTGILFNNFLSPSIMAWIVLALCILSSIFISISGIGHYKNYRYEQLAKDKTKKAIEKQKEKEKELEEKVPLVDPLPVKEPIVEPVKEKEEARL